MSNHKEMFNDAIRESLYQAIGKQDMGKTRSYYQNELLLEREDEIRMLNRENRKLHKYISELRFALLKVNKVSEQNVNKHTHPDTVNYIKNIVKKVLNNE